MAEFLPFGAYKTYDLLLATAPTVGEALAKAAKYNGFVNDAFRPTLQERRGRVCNEYVNCVDPQCNPPEYLEFIFACFLLRASASPRASPCGRPRYTSGTRPRGR